MTYTIVTKLNDWNVFGERINVRTANVWQTESAIEAGKALTEHGVAYKNKDHSTMFVIDNRTGTTIGHIELYAAVVGPEVFGAQLADEKFTIILDDFFRSL